MAQSLASAAESNPPLNSTLRGEMIRAAMRWLAEREFERKMINIEISEYKQKHIKEALGFKLRDWEVIYRASRVKIEDRDVLLDTVREGFQALGIGGSVDWVAAAEHTPRSSNGRAEPDELARAAGRLHGLHGITDHAAYPQGEPGHGDYQLGLADGQAERDRVMALGNGAKAPKRPRGRPRKPRSESEAGAEA